MSGGARIAGDRLSGFDPLAFFLSAKLLLLGCWLSRWLVYFHDVELVIGKRAG
jgi:hypothetical protein